MENNKLKININLKTGKYAFDNEEEVYTTLMKNEDTSLISKMKRIRDEIVEEYGFSAEMISRVDPILYEKLKEYDTKKGTRYNTRYLNVAAKEIERKENEPMGVYLERCAKIRKKALEETGIEIDYVMATRSEMKDMSLIEKLEVLRMAKRQTAIGATISEKSIYDEDIAKKDESAVVLENQVKEIEVDTDSEIKPEQVLETQTDSHKDENIVEQEAVNQPKMSMPSFLQEVLDKRDSVGKNVETDTTMPEKRVEVVKVENSQEQTVKQERTRVAKKTLSRRQTIQASKKAMRESRKMKNIYKQKMQQDSKPQTATTRPVRKEKPKTQQRATTDTQNKGVEFIPIKDGKMIGIDESRPSAIVRTFVLENPIKEKGEETNSVQDTTNPQTIAVEAPKEEGIVHRYTRKLKNKADSIKNRIAMSKDRFKRAAAVVAAGAAIVVAGILIIPKAVATIPLVPEQASEITIQAYDGIEQVSAKELEVDAEAPIVKISGDTVELERDVSSYIRNIELTSTGNVTEKESLSSGVPQTVQKIEQETLETSQPEVEEKSEQEREEDSSQKDREESQEDGKGEDLQEESGSSKEDIDENDSYSYLDSIKIGSRMKIDSGRYFANPDGTGNSGKFENHAGEAKILTIIGIATDDGYIPITNDSGDVTLLELKQQYPNAKFSYHFEDENGHVLGWLTSESFENIAEKQVDDSMER